MIPAASVIIPVRNAEAVLGDQLAALSRQVDAPQFEVVVVLNRCADHSGLVADSYRSRLPLTVLTADEKAGPAYARNVGAARSSAPHLLFCDADDRVGEGWVRAMVRALVDTDADVVGGRPLVDRHGLRPWIYDYFYREVDAGDLRYWGGVRYQITATLGIRRAAFEAVSGFDESFGTSHEEIDLVLRLVRQGSRIRAVPDAEVLYRPRTRVRDLVRQRRDYADGGARLLWKEDAPRAPSPSRVARQIVRAVGRRAVREPEWRPTALVVTALDEWFRSDAIRRRRRDGSARLRRPHSVSDFVVPPETPLVGGLGFRCDAADAYWYATDGVDRTTVAVVAEVLRAGDVFVDCRADVGVLAVAAATRLGASGRVVAFESDPRTREMLVANLERHRVSDSVVVRGDARAGESDGTLSDAVTTMSVDARGAKPTPDQLFRWFQDGRWALWLIDGRRLTDSRLLPREEWDLEVHADPQWRGSVLVVPRHRAADVRAAIDRVASFS